MVVRSSFVTNSSSSSFVCVDINSKEIVDILHEFEAEMEDAFEMGGVNFISDTEVSIFVDEMSADHPQTPEDIVHAIAGLFAWNYYEDYGYAQEDGEELDLSDYPAIIQRLVECKDEIMANLKAFKMSCGSQGWQGDDESRYEESWYTPEHLEEVKAAIADEKGIEIDEVTNDDFCEYVADMTSTEEDICEYNPETKEFTYRRTTELL